MSRKRAAIGLAAVGLPVVGVLGLLFLRPGGPDSAAGDSTNSGGGSTATVERRDLVDRESVSGSLGYGDAHNLSSPRQGTITALPAEGSVIERGQSLVEIDGTGVPLFYGSVPMYRALQSGVDDGADVRQLEENLDALGFAGSGFTVDDHFDSATAAAVRRWQKSLGRDQTGAVAVEDLVFEPGAIRVGKHSADVGGSAGSGMAVYEATGTTRIASVRLEVSRQSLAKAGDKARVKLPDGTTVDGTILSVGTVASKDSETAPAKITVTVVLDDQAAAASLTEAPVTVDFTKSTAQGVLAVPVRSLLALAEGGYAVEVVRDGKHNLVPVELGAFADGYVEVKGRLQEGEKVVMPR
jgi:peptidoglycan hydrolase-like protein with peptidoglycan-binding domain